MAEKGIPEIKELINFSSEGLNWLFAVIVGTLLWILSNFDKFKVGSPIFMPYKNLYVLSIFCVTSSSILLAIVLGRLYWSNYKVIKAFGNYSIYLKKFNRHFIELKIKKDMIDESVELAPLPELNDDMTDFVANFKSFSKILDQLTNYLDTYLNQFSSMYQILGKVPFLLSSLVAYFLGLILIAIYIILFMYNYL